MKISSVSHQAREREFRDGPVEQFGNVRRGSLHCELWNEDGPGTTGFLNWSGSPVGDLGGNDSSPFEPLWAVHDLRPPSREIPKGVIGILAILNFAD